MMRAVIAAGIGALLFGLFTAFPVSATQIGVNLSVPDSITQSPAYISCGGNGATSAATLLYVARCLINSGDYMAAAIVVHAVGYDWTQELNAPDYYDNSNVDVPTNGIEQIQEALKYLEDKERLNPEYPNGAAAGDDCKHSAISHALEPPNGVLLKARLDAIAILDTDKPMYEAGAFNIFRQAVDFLGTADGNDLVGQCYFSKGEWGKALDYFRSAVHLDTTPTPEQYWHLAIISERLGHRSAAVSYIRNAYNSLTGQDGSNSRQIKYDYNRLGAAKIDARANLQVERNAEREAAAKAHQQLAENHEYWDGISYDERRVIEHYGGTRDSNDDARPCNVSVDDNAYVGRILIWYYDCITPGGIGKESWEFVNGKLQEHQTL